MEKLRENHGAPTVERALRHLSIRLKASSETAAFAAPIDAARKALAEADEAYKQAMEERVAASAEVEYLDGQLDAMILDLSREVFALVGGDRADPRYRALFPTTPSEAVRGVADDGQARFVRHILEVLKTDPDLKPLEAHAPALSNAAAALEMALAAREEKYLPETQAMTKRRIALEAARREYNLAYPRLLAALQDEARVESFFLRLRRGKVSSDVEEPVEG